MGYYTNRQPSKKTGWFIPVMIGIAVGILFITVIYPNLSSKNDPAPRHGSNTATNNDTGTALNTKVNVDVSTQVTDIIDKVSEAVVGVTNIQRRNDFWMQGEEASEAGTGSGVIYRKDEDFAYIVTNHHVVDGADMLEVVLKDETNLEAELLGSDLFTDLAVLRVDAKDVGNPIELGSSEELKVGEPAIAIGNPLGHMFAGSVTQGIISGKRRTIPQDFNQDGRPDWQAEVIQTDAAINPGNSGGALINIAGQLIGINSMKINQEIAQGIGFAIPIDAARPIMKDLEEIGYVQRPYLGVEIYSLEEVPQVEWRNTLKLPQSVTGGVYIWRVEPLSPAAQAGLERLDVITEFDGETVLDILDLRKILYEQKKIGDEVMIRFYRDGKEMETTVQLGEQR